jgi:hypothetical protein
MRRLSRRRVGFAALMGVSAAFTFAALASVGAAVSPASPPSVAAQYPKKVTICHRTKSKKNPYVTIRVSRNALKAHLRHGDGIGPCPKAIFTVCHKAKNGKHKTMKVKGAKAHRKHLKRGDKIGACKTKKHKSKENEKHKGKGKKEKKKKKG